MRQRFSGISSAPLMFVARRGDYSRTARRNAIFATPRNLRGRIMKIRKSVRAYERWLRAELKGQLVEKDVERKRKLMRQGPFPFLRATYWRWSETILDTCPDLADAPKVLAIGDIHIENYGSWRDAEG